MSNLWERFSDITNTAEVAEATSKFSPVPAGDYVAVLESIEAGESKAGLPMLKVTLRTDTNRVIFINHMLQNLNYPNITAQNVAEATLIIDGFTGEKVPFENLSQLAQRIEGITLGKAYNITISYGKKDLEMSFAKLKVNSIVDDGSVPFDGDDETIPF